MPAMGPETSLKPAARRVPWAALLMVALTASLCVTALILRTPLRSRYWAWRITRCQDPAERAVYLTALCNAGDAARWGIAALLDSGDAESRQLGVVVLQHVRGDWSRQRLLDALTDADGAVRDLAAVGLALQGDDAVVPKLKEMYADDDAAAQAACLALSRLGSSAAVAAMSELVQQPADAAHRAALVDALDELDEPACVPPLLTLLDDHRACTTPRRSERVAQAMLDTLAATGRIAPPATAPASQAASQPAPQTIAERAAAALARITGLSPPFSSVLHPAERQAAAQQWSDWYAEHRDSP
jgi:hypothetical protein